MIRGAFIATVGTIVLLASQAEAENWYFQALVGQRLLSQTDLTLEGTSSEVSAFDDPTNPSGSGALGYRIPAFPLESVDARVELEVGVSENEPDTIEPRGVLAQRIGTTRQIGINAKDLMAISGMANLWIDHSLGGSWVVSGGGGLGAAYIDYDRVNVGTVPENKFLVILDDSDVVFAYQAGVGVGYEILPNLVTSLDYRYFATADPQLSFAGDWETEYGSHNFFLGLRYFFR